MTKQKEEPKLDERNLEQRVRDCQMQYWDKHKDDLLVFRPSIEYEDSGFRSVSPADGNKIVKELVYNAFKRGWDCGTAVMFSGCPKDK
jgi:hypothetical protein